MTKETILLAVCAFVTGAVFGQGAGFARSEGFAQSEGFGQSRIQFRSTEWAGLSTGEAGSAGQVQTVNGVSRGPWFVGVGAGLDYYRFRSIPLFLSVTRDLAIGKRDWLFLYLDGGTNVPWYKRSETPDNAFLSDAFHGGEYWSGGLGYVWKLGDHTGKAVLFSAGYTVKKLSEDEEEDNTCMLMDCHNLERFEYLNRMYMFMIGFRF
jgi:hypothetical protein